MRIASYNIRKAVGLDWQRDPDRIINVLAEIDADILVLQEADQRLGARAGVLPLERLEQAFQLELAEVSVRAASHGWHGNAVLVQRRLTIETAARINLPYLDPRGAIRVGLNPGALEIIGTHLGLTPRLRRRQLARLCPDMAGADHPVILAGDFNEWNTAKFALAPGLTLVTPGPSYHAARPVAALDRFIVNDRIRVLSAHVHRSALARRASDHLPIVLDFETVEAA